MPKKFDDCVKTLKKQGKSDDAAYAICVSGYMKKHGKSPFKKEELFDSGLPDSVQSVLLKVTEGGGGLGMAIAVLEGMGEERKVKVLENEIVGRAIRR